MPSTFIQRMCDPESLTDAQKAVIAPLVSDAEEEGYKLAVMPVCDVAQQIVDGLIPAVAMLTWITPAEKVDADFLLARISDQQDSLTIDRFERLCRCGERKVFSYQEVETILGIP